MLDGVKGSGGSSMIRMLRWPESEERRSLVTLSRAVSVLCCEQKPNLNVLNKSLQVKWVLSWEATTHSRILTKMGHWKRVGNSPRCQVQGQFF